MENPSLALRNVVRFSDDSGFSSVLEVRSRGLFLRHPFYFGLTDLHQCLSDLRKMNATLTGSTRLGQEYELDEIQIEVQCNGHVTVSGEMHESLVYCSQEVHFCFKTDQTVLGPLIRELEDCVIMDVSK